MKSLTKIQEDATGSHVVPTSPTEKIEAFRVHLNELKTANQDLASVAGKSDLEARVGRVATTALRGLSAGGWKADSTLAEMFGERHAGPDEWVKKLESPDSPRTIQEVAEWWSFVLERATAEFDEALNIWLKHPSSKLWQNVQASLTEILATTFMVAHHAHLDWTTSVERTSASAASV